MSKNRPRPGVEGTDRRETAAGPEQAPSRTTPRRGVRGGSRNQEEFSGETRLGQSIGKAKGRGVGPHQVRGLYQAFAESKAVETGLLTDLSDCGLFIDGIRNDKISDITTNIIRRKLVEFTKEECLKWDVPDAVQAYRSMVGPRTQGLA